MRVSGDVTVDSQVHVPDMQVAASPGTQVQWLGGLYGGMLVRAASSARYKDNIEPLQDDFYKILRANPRSFNCKTTGQRGIGFIAEEFDELGLCNLVTYDQDDRPDAISYKLISVYLLEILKDQVQTTDRLKAEHESLKQKTQSLEQRLEVLERTMGQYKLAVAKEVQK
jgi:hypothetical protein